LTSRSPPGHDPDRAAEAIQTHLDAIVTGVEMLENFSVFTVTR